MSEDVEFISSEFDIFAPKPVQTAILETNVVHYKPIATVDQNDLEFLVPGDNETYIDLDIKLFVKGKLLGGRTRHRHLRFYGWNQQFPAFSVQSM